MISEAISKMTSEQNRTQSSSRDFGAVREFTRFDDFEAPPPNKFDALRDFIGHGETDFEALVFAMLFHSLSLRSLFVITFPRS